MKQKPFPMETNPHNPIGEGTPPAIISQPTPLDVIRTETVFSKLPIHNLAKKGRVDIQITKMGPSGQVDLKWEVSYSERYGQARQLAYKLDTIVVDQRIEEAGKPLPERIRLGSLHEICRDLGLSEGENKNSIKRAFFQNASAFITTKMKYKSNDGTERTLEAGFTRYSVVFTGEKFPDGSRADAVYIFLNPPYREVLNNAPFRPLDLGYKKQLPPAAQRFYEIVSYKIFAALKYNLPHAKLPYSEYCTFSAQQRYFDYDHFKKQMYKIHRPHLAAGYITKVHYSEAADEQGRADWIMCYVPGPKARAEYATFSGKKTHLPATAASAAAPLPTGERTAESKQRRPRQRRLHLTPAPEPQPAVIIDYQVIAELARRGVGETDARQLLTGLPPGQPVLDQLEWGDTQIEQARGKITNPPGFYISLLQRNVLVPATFESSRARIARQAAESAQAEALQRQRQAALEAEEAARQNLDSQIDAMPVGDRQQLYTEAVTELYRQYPHLAAIAKACPGSAIHDGAIQSRMRFMITAGWKPHQAIKQPARQDAPLYETAAASPLFDLEALLATPLLPAPSEPALAPTPPAAIDPKQS